MIVVIAVLLFALAGAPVFAVMGMATQLAWFTHPAADMHHLRFLAPDVLDERFAGSAILTTIPLFTFMGFVMAESKAPERIVRASKAFFGWLPGGLAIVCIVASTFFTTLSSAITIVAVGGLLYPALVKNGYPKNYSIGVVMTGGSLGLLLPPSLPILIYSLVAGIDFTEAFKASVVPGTMVMGLMVLHAMYTGIRHDIPRSKPNLREMGHAFWEVKWEIGVLLLLLISFGSGLAFIDEAAALTALYVTLVELFIHKDLKFKDLARLASNSMALAGAMILIMALAMSLTNYLISEQIPTKLFEWVTSVGIKERWHFLLALNLFMWVMGAIMEGFSAILVAVPLLIPFGAEFHLSPFHLAMMFLLNLEIAFLSPPFGQNLFVASFRFNRPMASLYRVALPFLGILICGLLVIMYVPRLSTLIVEKDIAAAKAKAARFNEPPRDAWLLECVQEDLNNPLPCTDADRARWGNGKDVSAAKPSETDKSEAKAGEKSEDDIMKELLGSASADDSNVADEPKLEGAPSDNVPVLDLDTEPALTAETPAKAVVSSKPKKATRAQPLAHRKQPARATQHTKRATSHL